MKKNILELAKQAKLKFSSEESLSPAEEKFAELLIQECISKCEFVANMATITNTGEMARKTKATADSCATMIKQHFGVSE